LAVALMACEPILLAHASLAATDIAVTAGLLALGFHVHQGRTTGWLRRVALPAVWFAAAVLAKASGLAFGVLLLFVIECSLLPHGPWHYLCQPRDFVRGLWSSRWDFIQIVCLGLTLVLLYCGSDWQPQPSFVAWAHALPNGPFGRSMTWLAEHLCIFSNGAEGLIRQVKHNIRCHGAFLLGEAQPRAFWSYYSVGLSIKLS